MKLDAYVAAQAKTRAISKMKVLTEISEASSVSMLTLKAVLNGMRMGNYTKAKAVSAATGSDVSIKDLCE